MPCANCVNRREFLATAAGVAGLAVLSGCGDGQLSGVSSSTVGGGGNGGGMSNPIVITVATFPQLATAGQLVEVTSTPAIAVKRTGNAAFEAFSMRCTHQGCTVDIISAQTFTCPCHGSRFANDGSVVQGPAQQPLNTFSTSYDSASDQLTIG